MMTVTVSSVLIHANRSSVFRVFSHHVERRDRFGRAGREGDVEAAESH